MSETRPLDVRCPHCKAQLEVDAATGEVLDHVPPERKPRDFDSRLGDVLKGASRREDAFRSAMRAESKRSETLGRKFDKARRRTQGGGPDGDPADGSGS